MSSPERAPSLIALAAACESLNAAAVQVRGVREWMQRYDGDTRRLTDEEATRLWVFTERTREVVNRVRADTDELADVLVRLFLDRDGSWPLTEEQRREFHEVLAALAAREVQEHHEALSESPVAPEEREAAS